MMTDAQRAGFALSKQSGDFTEALVLLTYAHIQRAGVRKLSAVYHELQRSYRLSKDDVDDALRVLKNPVCFKAIHEWVGKSEEAVLVKTIKTPEIEAWRSDLLNRKPYLELLIRAN